MKVLFGLALRQTTGFVESLLRAHRAGLGGAGLQHPVPAPEDLGRDIPYRGSQGQLHLLIDSTGIRAEGEGGWHARKHGGPKRRLWRKIHLMH